MGPGTFLTLQGFLWYNCSAVSGSSAWWPFGGANGNLLQEDLCHMPCVPGLLQPEPLSLRQATADLYFGGRHSNTLKRTSGSVSLGSLGSSANKI